VRFQSVPRRERLAGGGFDIRQKIPKRPVQVETRIVRVRAFDGVR
jgi:hypothetical protein